MPSIKTLNTQLFSGIQPGRWVAISQDQERVVGTGRRLQEVLRKAKEQGEKKPFIIRVPAKDSALIL